MSAAMSTLHTTIKLSKNSPAPPETIYDVSMDGENSLIMGQTNAYPEIMNDDVQIEYALLRMVAAGVNIQYVLNLAQLSPLDIIEPDYNANYPSLCPYIIISYAPDTEESMLAVQHNARPIQHTQDGSVLMVPGFRAMRKQLELDNESTMIMVLVQETGAHNLADTCRRAQDDDAMDTDLSASDDPDASLDSIGSSRSPDYSCIGTSWTGGTADLLDAVAESHSRSGTVEPWQTRLNFLAPNLSEMSIEDWGDEYDWTKQDENEGFGMDIEQEGWCADDVMEVCEDEIDAEPEEGSYDNQDEGMSVDNA
ncbi:hypothetical protein FRC06_002541 [Ceratobasidium sp. 370]|nr:hypothetical protein FRC06_002541 [Ceratobasidium sp. 370]